MGDLDVLRAVDFDWTRHTSSIWQDSVYHAPELHAAEREALLAELDELARSGGSLSPLGQVILGPAGSGKTHLLGSLRQAAIERGAWFVLVDMTDVHDFWETTRQGFLDSLLQPLPGDEYQYQRLLRFLLAQVPQLGDSRAVLAEWADLDSELLHKAFMRWVAGSKLDRRYRKEFMGHFYTLRALFLLNSNDFFMRDAGYSWLQSIEMDQEDRQRFGFRQPQPSAAELVQGLSWAMSLAAPTLLAYDQLDAIVAQHHLASYGIEGKDEHEATEQERAAAGIINGIGGGLLALHNQMYRTLTVVSCLERTWKILEERTVRSFADRFDIPPKRLQPLGRQTIAEQLIANRLEAAFGEYGFEPPYRTWPFRPEAFADAHAFLPRELLKRCDAHRRRCLEAGRIIELDGFDGSSREGPGPDTATTELDRQYDTLKTQAPVDDLTGEADEDTLAAEVIQAACRCLIKEHALPDPVDAAVDEEFAKGGRYMPLHARLRLIFHDQGDREQHFCFRVLHKTHAKAYQSRLKAAMTASGIDRRLHFRRLAIVRNNPLPGGRITEDLTRQFRAAEGLFTAPDETEWRSLWALAELERHDPANFEAWLRARRPASGLALMRDSGAVAALEAASGDTGPDSGPPAPGPAPAGDTGPETKLLLGQRYIAGRTDTPVLLQTGVLTRHTVVLAGSGSGKTVLIRRLVESAALAGIPAIVVDPANDLARLGDEWPEAPEGWLEDDPQRARRYRDHTDVVIWTPGRERGNPLYLSPLPDLAAVVDDPDDLRIAIALALDALKAIAAPGASANARNKTGVLAAALNYFAHQGGGDLDRFIALLADLPRDAGAGISNAATLADQMADSLRAAIQTNPLLQSAGRPMTPELLFGIGNARTRVSVLNLSGLPALEQQQQFLAQLAMTLFTWIKRHPAPPENPVRGLLVLDEARDFLPANQQVPSRESLLRLAAQARKYGLGLVFATQAPKSIDYQAIANCTTQFYGKAMAPRTIEVIQEQIRQRGGSGSDVAQLETGVFYLYSEDFNTPFKIRVPMCLSHHAATPLDEEDILTRAARSKTRLGS